MLLTATEFDQKISSGELRIALIGMSNIGKSYTAKRISRADNFQCYDVDAKIQAKLGKSDMDAVADWMGHPFDNGYNAKATEYLSLEADLSLTAHNIVGNIVLDTTGSVVHIPNNNIKSLKSNNLIIYIKANKDDIDTLSARYFKYPKPTIWGNCFHNIKGRSDLDSLLDSYPGLLAHRAKLYSSLADITIAASVLANPDLKDEGVLPLIRSYLA